jgi:hypothetical protein
MIDQSMIDTSTWTVSSHICTAGADNSISFKPNLRGSLHFRWSIPRLKGSNLSAIKPLAWKCKGRSNSWRGGSWLKYDSLPFWVLTKPTPPPPTCVPKAPILTKNDARLITKGRHVRSAASFLKSRPDYFSATMNPPLSNSLYSLHECLDWFQLTRQY